MRRTAYSPEHLRISHGTRHHPRFLRHGIAQTGAQLNQSSLLNHHGSLLFLSNHHLIISSQRKIDGTLEPVCSQWTCSAKVTTACFKIKADHCGICPRKRNHGMLQTETSGVRSPRHPSFKITIVEALQEKFVQRYSAKT